MSSMAVVMDEEEMDLICHLLRNFNGCCTVDKLRDYVDESNANRVIDYVRQFRQVKVLNNNANTWKSVAFAFVKRLRLCVHSSRCRNPGACQYLHLCRDLVADPSHDSSSCPHDHDISKIRQLSGVVESDLDLRCSDDELLAAVRCSNVSVCTDWPGCDMDVCIRLHVCSDFINRSCTLPGAECPSGHVLTSGRNFRLLSAYELKRMVEKQDDFLFRVIVVADVPRCQRANRRTETDQNATDPRCSTYEEHVCDLCDDCIVRHSAAPFLWRLMTKGRWVPMENSELIEREFCDPNRDYFRNTEMTIDFSKMTCSLGAVQRLSTPSYVVCRQQVDATRWRWYVNRGNDKTAVWQLYEDIPSLHQDIIESKFNADATQMCCYDLDGVQYQIDFIRMNETNQETRATSAIRRRPTYYGHDATRANSTMHYDPRKLPAGEGWCPMDTETPSWAELVPVSAHHKDMKKVYEHVTSKFYATLPPADYVVHRVFRVQNLEIWKKYHEQFLKMRHRLPHSAIERQLFHGTSDKTSARCICHQNFDPRLHGTHIGTRHGKGAYFSTTARKGDLFTQASDSTRHRFMFYARVLVGQSVQGMPDYQRPPPLDPRCPYGALYDSCVDDVENPHIFVIFDNAQCYPEFLIEYEEMFTSSTRRPRSIANQGNQCLPLSTEFPQESNVIQTGPEEFNSSAFPRLQSLTSRHPLASPTYHPSTSARGSAHAMKPSMASVVRSGHASAPSVRQQPSSTRGTYPAAPPSNASTRTGRPTSFESPPVRPVYSPAVSTSPVEPTRGAKPQSDSSWCVVM